MSGNRLLYLLALFTTLVFALVALDRRGPSPEQLHERAERIVPELHRETIRYFEITRGTSSLRLEREKENFLVVTGAARARSPAEPALVDELVSALEFGSIL